MKLQKTFLVASLMLATAVSTSAMAAIDVSGAAEFQSDFTTAAATIGAAFLAAGFVAVAWKWVRGMLFS